MIYGYRVEDQTEKHGIWRDFDGNWNPIFEKLSDGLSKDLPMEDNSLYHQNGKDWFSAAPTKETLTCWFSRQDVIEMARMGYKVYEFELKEAKKVSELEIIFTRDNIISQKELDYKEIWDINNKIPQIITSLLSNDLYKFSMGQVIYHQFSGYKTTWTFKCRNKDVFFTPEMVQEIKEQIRSYCQLRFTKEELEYLHNITWLKGSYVDFLRLWQPRYEDFEITTSSECGLSIETKGTWLNTSMYEVPVLAIVNEVYFRMAHDYEMLFESFKERLNEKVNKLVKGSIYAGTFSEFGLRRRLSAEAQELVVKTLSEARLCSSIFIGTSNVYLAKKYNLKPVGTVAHEFFMCVGQGDHRHNPAYSNWYAMDSWVKEYGILNGTALTDTITTDCFLRDFQLTFATLFSGVRHDSGDPFVWGDKMIEHYKALGIDYKTKTLLFSDSLDFEKADELFRYFNAKGAKVAFGIGTYLSNDTCVNPLNIVMKVTKCNGSDVAKLSDVNGKGMCKNPEYVDYLTRCINWRMEKQND